MVKAIPVVLYYFCIIMYDGSCAPHTGSPPSDWIGTLTLLPVLEKKELSCLALTDSYILTTLQGWLESFNTHCKKNETLFLVQVYKSKICVNCPVYSNHSSMYVQTFGFGKRYLKMCLPPQITTNGSGYYRGPCAGDSSRYWGDDIPWRGVLLFLWLLKR